MAILLFASIVIISIFSLRLLAPPAVVPSAQGDEKFSAERALIFLSVIASEPHPSGTPAHERVRDYIFNYCQRMGLETQIMDKTGVEVYPKMVRAGRAQSIIARLKGTGSGKAILVMAHYDSQPHTPGATDDGAGVAAMMEAIRLLKNFPPLKNDVLFLFTDQEETGLFGAQTFVEQYDKLQDVGLIMNFEARGNAGVDLTFEFSSGNGWVVKEYSKAVKAPLANSFAYEIYKAMPNDTDFTMFRKTGIAGFNSAYIEGHSYYHSMVDRIENMDLRSLQNHGNILIQSLKHFGDLSLDNTKSEDVVFFNPVGTLLWIYPLGWDVPLMVLAIVLWLVVVMVGYRSGRIKVGPIFGGAGLFLGFLILSSVLSWGLAKLVSTIYPHYTNFYNNDFYNISDYFFTIIGLVLLSFILLFKKTSVRASFESVLMGSVFMLLLLMVGIKWLLHTGAYLLYYPVIILLVVYLVLFWFKITRDEKPTSYGFAQLILITPALLLWMPMAYIIYVVFSLALPFGAVVMLAFCVPFLIASLGFIQSWAKTYTWVGPTLLIFIGLMIGHRNSEYTTRYPLQSELMYVVDTDANAAFWVSNQKQLDTWLQHYIKTTEKQPLKEIYPTLDLKFWKNSAPVTDISKGKIVVLKDSVVSGTRLLTLQVMQDSLSLSVDLNFSQGVELLKVNEGNIDLSNMKEKPTRLNYSAPAREGIKVELKAPAKAAVEIRVVERKLFIPSSVLTAPMPDNFITAPGNLAGTTQVKYTVKI